MVRAWQLAGGELEDPQAPNMMAGGQLLDIKQLEHDTGVEYFPVNAADFANDETLQRLRRERGYGYEDSIQVDKDFPEDKMKMLYEEHLHNDEEIRLVLEGQGYFDIRNVEDGWIRVEVSSGDLLILPAGIYHRFTLSKQGFVKANRYFQGEPVWVAFNRKDENTGNMASRQQYLTSVKSK